MLINTKDFWSSRSKEIKEIRDIYVKDGEVLLMVAPDPSLSAGKPYGYLFHFTAPFETFKGKDLAIYAYHKETGEKITGLAPEIIKEPSTGYPTLDRFTATFSVPKSGLWRYEVVVDGEFYAEFHIFNEKRATKRIQLLFFAFLLLIDVLIKVLITLLI